MKSRKKNGKLGLIRETVRMLSDADVSAVRGGAGSDINWTRTISGNSTTKNTTGGGKTVA